MAHGMDDLISRARAGDADAFASLVAEHGADVLRLCTVITTDPTLAEDAAQNAWRQVWRRLSTVRDSGSFRAWLLRVAANEAKQVLRRNQRHAALRLDTAREVAGSADPGESADVRAALRTLAPADRELVAWRYVLGMNSVEIGLQIGLSPEGVRSRLKRIRDQLRKELDK